MKKIFIDGSAGTTGLRIFERLSSRKDIELIRLSEERRKDTEARREAINGADIVFLCLPDDAAREAVGLCENENTVIIDTSTAHRTSDDWAYGFPELTGMRGKIANSKRIANPGCHASGFIALVAPLVEAGAIGCDAHLSAFSLTGFSGGGKKMISEYTDPENEENLRAPRVYGLSQNHKHLAEMTKACGLDLAPHFFPIVSSYYAGMEVTVTLFADELKTGFDGLSRIYSECYTGDIVRYREGLDENGFISAGAFCGRDDMEIGVFGNKDRVTVVSRFDNLGKGASGAAIQNMNIVLGLSEKESLNVEVE